MVSGAVVVVILMVVDCGLIWFSNEHFFAPDHAATLVLGWVGFVALSCLLSALIGRVFRRSVPHWGFLAVGAAAGGQLAVQLVDPLVWVIGACIGWAFAAWFPRGSSVSRSVALVVGWCAVHIVLGSAGTVEAKSVLPDVVIVTIDTVREDALSSSSNALIAGLTPNLDVLASEGCSIGDAVSTSPLTGPSHAAMFSGLHPLDMGLFQNAKQLPDGIPWLPETLDEQGYQTAAFVSSAMLDADLGYSRGFDLYDDDLAGDRFLRLSALGFIFEKARLVKKQKFARKGQQTVKRMQRWLRTVNPNQPVFVWLHLYDAHRPYQATLESRRFVKDAPLDLPSPESFPQWKPMSLEAKPSALPNLFDELSGGGAETPLKGTTNELSRRYLAGVRDLDGIVGAAWTALDAERNPQKRVWSVLADHGESLTEHGELGSHQYNVYEANIRVPYLLSKGPCPENPVSTTTLSSTILERAGVDLEWKTHLSIEAVVRAGKGAPSHASSVKVARRTNGEKVILGFKGEDLFFSEVYDLSNDPHEQHPSEGNRTVIDAMANGVRAKLEGAQPTESSDDSVMEGLRALGYVD